MLMSLGLDDCDAPLTKKQLRNPKSRVVCLILYLYSIEPPFYAELNSACRLLDKSKLQTLGPFARALFEILNCGLTESLRPDTLDKGQIDGPCGPYGYFSQSFLLFKGACMKPEWLRHWTAKVGKKTSYGQPESILMRGNICTTRCFAQALSHCRASRECTVPVLFVMSMQNYFTYYAFRLNSQQYSAHHHEDEYLLMDGIAMYVIKV